jgi:hypothetical protein
MEHQQNETQYLFCCCLFRPVGRGPSSVPTVLLPSLLQQGSR